MRGVIIKRGDAYSVVLSLGNDPVTGKRIRQWVPVKGGAKAAEKRLTELLNQLDTGSFVKLGKTTVAEYLQKWLTDYAKPNLGPRSFERYRDIVRAHLTPDLGSIPLARLRPDHLQALYTGKLSAGLSPRTVRYIHAVLHVALQTAVKWGLVGRNVADAVDPPRIRRSEMQTWDESEIGRFLETAKDSPYYALFYTALFTGMRRSELLALRWNDVDPIYCQISVSRSLHHLKDGSYVFTEPKSEKSRRTIALPPSLVLALNQHRANQVSHRAIFSAILTEDDLVFCDDKGKPIRPNTVTRAWQTLAARAGLRVIRLHDARHSHASLMLKQGIHPKIVQERLGHSSITMTLDTYSHVAPGLQESAALSFDKLVTCQRENGTVERVG